MYGLSFRVYFNNLWAVLTASNDGVSNVLEPTKWALYQSLVCVLESLLTPTRTTHVRVANVGEPRAPPVDKRLHPSGVIPRMVGVHTHATLVLPPGSALNMEAIALNMRCIHDPEYMTQISCTAPNGVRVTFFPCGTFCAMNAKSMEDAQFAIDVITRVIIRCVPRPVGKSHTLSEISYKNKKTGDITTSMPATYHFSFAVVGKGVFLHNISTMKRAILLSRGYTMEFDPERFPGLKVASEQRSVIFIFFASGNVTAKASSPSSAVDEWEGLWTHIKDCIKT